MGWPARNLPFGGTGKELLIWFRKFLLLSDNMRHYGLFFDGFWWEVPDLVGRFKVRKFEGSGAAWDEC